MVLQGQNASKPHVGNVDGPLFDVSGQVAHDSVQLAIGKRLFALTLILFLLVFRIA